MANSEGHYENDMNMSRKNMKKLPLFLNEPVIAGNIAPQGHYALLIV
jgi:hypothetical protein